MLSALILEGVLLGWSVAWPPGPINAEILRRALARGFAAGLVVALGAGTGDALWAVATALGAGIVATGATTRTALGISSTVLLAVLAYVFLNGAWRGLAALRAAPVAAPARGASGGAGYGLGLAMALTSPWNLAFWLAVMGRPELAGRGLETALIVAAAVVAGALSWGVVFCTAIGLMRRRLKPGLWEVVAGGATGLVMLAFAVRGALRLAGV